MHNDSPKWGSYAANCIRRIRARQEACKIALANREERIFTDQAGGHQIKWTIGRNGMEVPRMPADKREGWREKETGTAREHVIFYEGFGWLSSGELFDLRQQQPRAAP